MTALSSRRAIVIGPVPPGIGVLFTYGSKGRRELPNSQVIVDGPPENLSTVVP